MVSFSYKTTARTTRAPVVRVLTPPSCPSLSRVSGEAAAAPLGNWGTRPAASPHPREQPARQSRRPDRLWSEARRRRPLSSRETQQWPGRHRMLCGRSRTRGGPAGDTEPRVRPGVPRSVPRLSFLFLACSQNKLPTRRARQAGCVRGGQGPGEGRLCTVASRSQGTDCRFSPALGSSGTGVRRPGVFASLHPDGLIPRYLPS